MANLRCVWGSHIALIVTVLLIILAPVVPAGRAIAAPDELKWSPVNMPTEGRTGNWVLATGSDVQGLTQAIDGSLYARISGLTYTLYKSSNGGYSWSYIGNVRDNIVAIATSPRDPNWLYYATAASVYRSSDGGRTFVQLPGNPGGAGSNNVEITSLAVSWLNSHVVAVGTRDSDAAQFGGVYTLSEDQVISGWVDTNLAGYDVYAVAFSPGYAGDRQLVAVTTNETDTYVTTRTGYFGWGATAGNARLNRDNSMPPARVVVANPAVIAFPGDYDSSAGSGNNVLFVAVDTGSGNGDVHRINGAVAPANSSATDLNIGSAYGIRNIDITGLSVSGNVASARLIAGAASSAQTYASSDSGKNWTRSSKEPTGGSKTCVLIAGGKTYAATSGSESAISASSDNGATWNQVGLVDSTVSAIVDFSPSPAYSQDGTLFLLTFGGKHSLWRSTDGASTWERVFSAALANVDSLSMVEVSPQFGNSSRVLFVSGNSNSQPAIWQSADNGQKFNCRPARASAGGAPLPIDAWAMVNDTSLFIASYDGTSAQVYYTGNSGFVYSTGVATGSQPLNSIVLSPLYEKDQTILIGDANGGVYWSSDNGTSFEPLPPSAASPPLTGTITVAFDPKFASNRTVYAASSSAGKGVYRFLIGKSTAWEAIDSTLPTGGMLGQLMVSSDGVLYAANSKAGGGMERGLDPTYPLGPVFDTVTRGLNTNSTLVGLWQSGHKLWSIDSTNARLMSYTDTLTSPAKPTSPPDATPGTGSLINHTIKNVSLDWEAMVEATAYQWQLSYNTNFSTVPSGFEGTVDSSLAHLPTLEPGTRYYWRVRASAPVLSPWSARWSFTTSLDTEVVPLRLESPQSGVRGTPVRPLFQWGAVAGAEAYELLVSSDSRFANPVVAKTGDTALPTTAWQCDLDLKNDTTYYWKVRAVNASTASAWSAVNTFTTDSPHPTVPKIAPPPVTVTPVPVPPPSTPRNQPLSASPAQPAPPAPAVTPPPPAPPAPELALLPAMFNWIAWLVGGLLLAIMLLLVIVLLLVIRTRRG